MSLYGIAIESSTNISSQLNERNRIQTSIATALTNCTLNKCVIFSVNNSVYTDINDHNALTTYYNDEVRLNINQSLLFIVSDDVYYNQNVDSIANKLICFRDKLKEIFNLTNYSKLAIIKISANEIIADRAVLFNIDFNPQQQPKQPSPKQPSPKQPSPFDNEPNRPRKRSRVSEDGNIQNNKFEKLREKFEKLNLEKISIQRELDECRTSLSKCDSERDNLITKLDGLRDELKGFKSKDPESLRRSINKLNNELKRIVEEQEELERQEEQRRQEERRRKESEERKRKESEERRRKESEERRRKESDDRRKKKMSEERREEQRRRKESEERKKKKEKEIPPEIKEMLEQLERDKQRNKNNENKNKKAPVLDCFAKEHPFPDCSGMTDAQKKRVFLKYSMYYHPDKNKGCEEYASELMKDLGMEKNCGKKDSPFQPEEPGKKGGKRKTNRRKSYHQKTRKMH